MNTIIVIAETDNDTLTRATLECVEEAREIGDGLRLPLHALLPGHGVAILADELAAYGADTVTVVEHEALGRFSADGWLAALASELQDRLPALVLAPDTGHMRAWLPRLAMRWRVPLVNGCIQVKVDAHAGTPVFELTRPTYGGARHEQLFCPGTDTVFAMLAPDARGVGRPQPNRRAEVTHRTPDLDPAAFRDQVIRIIPPDPRAVDLGEAERIVSGGLGVGGPAGVDLLWRLADQLGAAVGGTRVIADRGWLPAERFIGTTGKIVAPKLYFAFGISGASQHISGMTGSETVIVVNIDRTAPLFGLADLGVVGDLHQIVAQVLAILEGRRADQAHDVAAPPEPLEQASEAVGQAGLSRG
ncbi:MAG TPA: electron transfer flavoprotein subunit alpha/FixB family protein [Roseiflexaceae bacterium]